jgi:hypothetical protein
VLEEFNDDQKHSALGFEMWCQLEDSKAAINAHMLELSKQWALLFESQSLGGMYDFLAYFINTMKLQMIYERELKLYSTIYGQGND